MTRNMQLRLFLLVFTVGALLLFGCSEKEKVSNAEIELKETNEIKEVKESKREKGNVSSKVEASEKFMNHFFSLERSELAKMIREDSLNNRNEFI